MEIAPAKWTEGQSKALNRWTKTTSRVCGGAAVVGLAAYLRRLGGHMCNPLSLATLAVGLNVVGVDPQWAAYTAYRLTVWGTTHVVRQALYASMRPVWCFLLCLAAYWWRSQRRVKEETPQKSMGEVEVASGPTSGTDANSEPPPPLPEEERKKCQVFWICPLSQHGQRIADKRCGRRDARIQVLRKYDC